MGLSQSDDRHIEKGKEEEEEKKNDKKITIASPIINTQIEEKSL